MLASARSGSLSALAILHRTPPHHEQYCVARRNAVRANSNVTARAVGACLME